MIKWWVAKWNKRGIEFYERLGAKVDSDGTNSIVGKSASIWPHPADQMERVVSTRCQTRGLPLFS
jgi:hypothetical protein